MNEPAPAIDKCDVCGKPVDGFCVESFDANFKRVGVRCHPCDMTQRFDRYAATKRLHTWLMTEVGLRHYDLERGRAVERADLVREAHASVERVRAEVREFDRGVWFGGLQKAVRASRTKGLSAKEPVSSPLGPVKVLAFAMAGRAMITLDAATCSVTVITAEDDTEPRMGIQGIDATEAEALALLLAVRTAWTAGTVDMVPDEQVGI